MNLTFPMSTSLSIAFQVTSKDRESPMSIAGWNYCLVEFRRVCVVHLLAHAHLVPSRSLLSVCMHMELTLRLKTTFTIGPGRLHYNA